MKKNKTRSEKMIESLEKKYGKDILKHALPYEINEILQQQEKEENEPIDLFNEEWSEEQILFQFCKNCNHLNSCWDFNTNASKKVTIPKDFPNCHEEKKQVEFKKFKGFYYFNDST